MINLKYIFVLLFLSTAWAGVGNANELLLDNSLTNNNNNNREFWQRFVPNAKMPSDGTYQGEKVDTAVKRPVKVLNLTEKKFLNSILTQNGIATLDESQLVFANFKHDGRHYIATLPTIQQNGRNFSGTAVQSVFLSEKHWAQKIRPYAKDIEDHTTMGFVMKKGSEIKLIADQTKNETANKFALMEPFTLSENLALSIEAVRSSEHPDADFMPGKDTAGKFHFNALGSDFALTYKIESWSEKERVDINETDAVYSIDDLKLNDLEADALLEQALITSQTRGVLGAYHVLNNNCTNNLFLLIDGAIKTKFDAVVFKRSTTDFFLTELPVLISKLESSQDAGFKDELKQYWNLLGLDDLKELATNPEKINAWYVERSTYSSLPAFIRPHLKARGILKED